jgi:hypothetical protein
MLSVSFSLALVAAMLFSIVLPGHHKEVDKFNGQTREPIPAGKHEIVSGFPLFKVERPIFRKVGLVSVCPAASAPSRAKHEWRLRAERF